MIDTHVHLWNPHLGYSWLRSAPRELNREFTGMDLADALRGTQTSKVILVEAGSGRDDEARIMLEAAATTPVIAGIVAPIALSDPRRAIESLVYARGGIVVGVRDSSAQRLQATPSALQTIGRHLSHQGLTLDLLADAETLAQTVRIVDLMPGIRIVIDHAASPPSPDEDDRWGLWRAGMIALAERDNVTVKVSGLLPASRRQHGLAGVADLLLSFYGPDRLMIGSDWPICLRVGSYYESASLAYSLSTSLSDNDRDKLLSLTAKRIYTLMQ